MVFLKGPAGLSFSDYFPSATAIMAEVQLCNEGISSSRIG